MKLEHRPSSSSVRGPETESETARLKIYLLPNLFTAGNLFCGFLAITKIVEADPAAANFNSVIRHALAFILLACILDLLDGRVARMGGFESPFGREFDSLADIVSFGVAPAFLVHRIVLRDVFVNHPEVGWFIASVFVICGAFRLARFNCLAAMAGTGGGKYFLGFPIPAAAGLVASITYLLLHLDDKNLSVGNWRYLLPGILIFLSAMMVSEVKYPTFKKLGWKTQRPFGRMVTIVLFIGMIFILWRRLLPYVAPVGIASYLIYGFVRPRISREMQREIEYENENEESEEDDGTDRANRGLES